MTSEEKSSSLPFSLSHYPLIMISSCGPRTSAWQEIRPSAYILALEKPHPNPTPNQENPQTQNSNTNRIHQKPKQPNEKTIGRNHLVFLMTIVGDGLWPLPRPLRLGIPWTKEGLELPNTEGNSRCPLAFGWVTLCFPVSSTVERRVWNRWSLRLLPDLSFWALASMQ